MEVAQPVLSTVDSQRVAEQNDLLVRIFAQEMAVDVTSVQTVPSIDHWRANSSRSQ